MRRGSVLFALVSTLMLAGCVTMTRPAGDADKKQVGRCPADGPATPSARYEVTWDGSCADYPVSSRTQPAAEPVALSVPPPNTKMEPTQKAEGTP